MTLRRYLASFALLTATGIVGGLGLGSVISGCTLFSSAAPTVLTATQDACQAVALAESFIPPGTSASAVAQDIELACGIAESAEAYLEQVVLAYEAAQDAGAAGGIYRPGPTIMRAKTLGAVAPKGKP